MRSWPSDYNLSLVCRQGCWPVNCRCDCGTGVLYFVSCTVNPILYNVMSRRYRQAFRETLCRCCSVVVASHQQAGTKWQQQRRSANEATEAGKASDKLNAFPVAVGQPRQKTPPIVTIRQDDGGQATADGGRCPLRSSSMLIAKQNDITSRYESVLLSTVAAELKSGGDSGAFVSVCNESAL